MDYSITYREKDKGWQYIINYKVDGQWKQKSKQGFSTKREAKPQAEKMVKELKKCLESNVVISKDIVTFKSFKETFIKHMSLYKEQNTIKSFNNCFSKFSGLDDIELSKIQKLNIQNIVDSFVIEGLKPNSIKTYLRLLNVIFKSAKEDYNLIAEIPCRHIAFSTDKQKNNKKALTKKELDVLLNNIKNNKFYIVAFIAGMSGLRLGEILGLTWKDIDEVNSTLEVNKQWKMLKDKKSGFGTLKSKNSYRTVPISSTTLNILKEYKKNNPTDIHYRIAPFNSSSINNYLNPELRKLNGISLHELRHTYATLLISNGIDFKTAAKLLGHSVEQTLRTYSHVTDDMVKNASMKIENIF